MKPLFFLLIFAIVLAFASCKQHHNEATGTPNSVTTNGPTDTTKMSETGSTPGISAQGQTKSLDTNHNVKAGVDSVKK